MKVYVVQEDNGYIVAVCETREIAESYLPRYPNAMVKTFYLRSEIPEQNK